jgi:hypothetical protein
MELADSGHQSVRQNVENSEGTNKPRRLDTSSYFLLRPAPTEKTVFGQKTLDMLRSFSA